MRLSLPEMGPDMAAKLLIEDRRDIALTPLQPPKGSGPAPKPMNRESQARFVAVLLFLLTVAAVVFAGFNLQKERDSAGPDDGVWWVEHNGRLICRPGRSEWPRRQGRHQDQRPTGLGQRRGQSRTRPALERQLYRTGVWSQGDLFAGSRVGDARFQRHSGSCRSLSQQLAAADCADLSRDRRVRSAATLDRAGLHALLHFLPGLVHRVFVQVHGQAQRF